LTAYVFSDIVRSVRFDLVLNSIKKPLCYGCDIARSYRTHSIGAFLKKISNTITLLSSHYEYKLVYQAGYVAVAR